MYLTTLKYHQIRSLRPILGTKFVVNAALSACYRRQASINGRIIYENLAVAIILIAGGLALSGAGWLQPVPAAFLQVSGALIVAFNSARLFRQGDDQGK